MRNQIIQAAMLPMLFIACTQRAQMTEKEKADAPMVAGHNTELQRTLKDNEQLENVGNGVAYKKMGADSAGTPGGPQQTRVAGHAQMPRAANPDWEKKIVKTAALDMEVKNYVRFSVAMHRAIREAGGYVAQEDQHESSYRKENSVVIKVPVDRFEESLLRLPSDSDKIVSKKISSEDVTMQIIDTKSRLETKREVRLRYLDLLRQAKSMQDILNVQHEIDGIQEEMDGATGRIAYLGHAAAYSTINLVYYQVLDASVKEEGTPSYFRQLTGALAEGWKGLSVVLFGLISIWPLLLALLLGWMGFRRWRGATAVAKK